MALGACIYIIIRSDSFYIIPCVGAMGCIYAGKNHVNNFLCFSIVFLNLTNLKSK